jgi:hypothetical protein
LPDNWWRTLFVTDIWCAPELVPGYTRNDFFNLSYMYERMRKSNTLAERQFSLIGLIVLYVPAYLYRLTIKSTCWLYLPLVYIVSRPSTERTPEILSSFLWRDPREWWRRFLMFVTFACYFIFNYSDPSSLLNPSWLESLRRIFAFNIFSIHSWQFFNLTSASITLGLLLYSGQFRALVEESATDPTQRESARNSAVFIEWAMRLRNYSTALLLVIAVVYAALLLTPISNHLPSDLVSKIWAL